MLKNKFLDKTVKYLKFAYMELLIIAGALFIDLLSKNLVAANVPLNSSVELIKNFLYVTYTQNTKAGFSFDFGLGKLLGENGLRIFFIVLTVIAVGFFVWLMYHWRSKGKVFRVSIALIIGGALGNLYDRIFIGYVRDFVEIVYFGQVWFGHTNFAIFNIADSCLVIGVILFAVYLLFIYKEPEKFREKPTTRQLNGIEEDNENPVETMDGRDGGGDDTARDIRERGPLYGGIIGNDSENEANDKPEEKR